MVTKTISQPSSTRKASQSASQNGGKSVSGVRAMRHLVNSDGTKGGDVIFDGHNFGPATDGLRILIEIHRAARRREEAAYAGDDDDITAEQGEERKRAHRAAMVAALDIMCDGNRPKADNVAVMLYASEAGDDFQALQSLSYSDLRVFRDAYSAHGLKLAKPPASNVLGTIQAHRAAIKDLLAAGNAIDLPSDQETTPEDMHTYYTACSAEIAAGLEIVALVNAAGNTDWALPEERAAIITYGEEQSSGHDPFGTDTVKLFEEVPYECIDVLRKWYQGELVEATKSASNDGTSSKLAELIDRHRATRQAVDAFDVHATPEAEQERIMAVASDAFEAVLSFRCNTIGDIQQKTDYLVNDLDNANRLFEGELDSPRTFISQFMRSMCPSRSTHSTSPLRSVAASPEGMLNIEEEPAPKVGGDTLKRLKHSFEVYKLRNSIHRAYLSYAEAVAETDGLGRRSDTPLEKELDAAAIGVDDAFNEILEINCVWPDEKEMRKALIIEADLVDWIADMAAEAIR